MKFYSGKDDTEAIARSAYNSGMYAVRTILSEHSYDVDLLNRIYPSLSEAVGGIVASLISVESYKET